jgi:hypothetical protein
MPRRAGPLARPRAQTKYERTGVRDRDRATAGGPHGPSTWYLSTWYLSIRYLGRTHRDLYAPVPGIRYQVLRYWAESDHRLPSPPSGP